MASKKTFTIASGILITCLLVSASYFNHIQEATAKQNDEIRGEIKQGFTSSAVTPVVVNGDPKIAVISDSPETELSALLLENKVPDEIYIVHLMKILGESKQNPKVSSKSLEQYLEMTSERLNILSGVLEKSEENHSYNNTQLLSQILEEWKSGKYSTLPQDLKTLDDIEKLNEEAFKSEIEKKAMKTARDKKALVQDIKKAVGEKKELSQEHFDAALENWFAVPHSDKEPYQLTVSERKKVAETIYPEGSLVTMADVLAEYEKMFTDPKRFTYDRYIALAYYLTSGQNKVNSYRFETFYALPFFPTEATDKVTAAHLINESYTQLHTFVDELEGE
ncbi:hypothetical protein H1230_16610 [Paenibacillus sp. 19GGS1-52]|uniref:hypothetical protein n=1 Tax=Paenibacillus sp. 19GGS1-52 TaxID=2758563 RepID=UPI001EFA4702|nr:hypothetical protein [Paenibacillus sp. 19GGS1-52]ULO04779.1 hypothetical protein H1230_16610 [Paenibacillus sp. 19GGS1-52]